jgi:glyoxylase-like metal-dependent hydrolase (beta-lactamase superfamily II)
MANILDGVFFIPGQDEMIPDSHVYLLGDPTGQDLSLVDAGLTGKGRYKLESIAGEGIPLENIRRIIMTHTHFDHIGCLREISDQIPRAEIWVHLTEADLLEQGDDRTVYGMDLFKEMCQRQYRVREGAFKFPVHRKLQDGESLPLGGRVWEVVHIPGHSMGSIALYNRESKILIPGDTVYADGAIGRFDLHGASASDLKKSLMKLGALEVDVLLPGHNRILTKMPKDYISKTAKQWEPYLV